MGFTVTLSHTCVFTLCSLHLHWCSLTRFPATPQADFLLLPRKSRSIFKSLKMSTQLWRWVLSKEKRGGRRLWVKDMKPPSGYSVLAHLHLYLDDLSLSPPLPGTRSWTSGLMTDAVFLPANLWVVMPYFQRKKKNDTESFPDYSPKLSPSKGKDPSVRAQHVQMTDRRQPSTTRPARMVMAQNSCTNELPSSPDWKDNFLIFIPLHLSHFKCINRARKKFSLHYKLLATMKHLMWLPFMECFCSFSKILLA